MIFLGAFHPYTIFFTLLVTPTVCYMVYQKLYANHTLEGDFKKEIVTQIIQFMDPSLTYSPEGYVGYDEFYASDLFHLKPDSFTGDDLIEGSIDGIHIKFSELDVAYRKQETQKDIKKERWEKIFHGVFLIADYPKPLKGQTIILSNQLQKKLGYIGRKVQQYHFQYGKYIHTGNLDFSDEFVVYADDELEGESILTDTLMERLLTLRKRNKASISMCLKDSKIYVALDLQRDFFKVSTNRNWFDFKYVSTFYDDIFYVLTAIDDLNIDELELPSEADSVDASGGFTPPDVSATGGMEFDSGFIPPAEEAQPEPSPMGFDFGADPEPEPDPQPEPEEPSFPEPSIDEGFQTSLFDEEEIQGSFDPNNFDFGEDDLGGMSEEELKRRFGLGDDD